MLWHNITKDSCARNTFYSCKFKLNKSIYMPSYKEWFDIHTEGLSNVMLTFKKRNTMLIFTHRFAIIFQSIFGSAH